MVAVAVVADKYEVAKALKYVAKEWSDPLWSLDIGCEDWVLISWVFEYEDYFRDITLELICRGEWTRAVGLTFGTEGDWTRSLSEFVSEAVVGKSLLLS
jgi:hypothetical protein